MTAVVVFGLFK